MLEFYANDTIVFLILDIMSVYYLSNGRSSGCFRAFQTLEKHYVISQAFPFFTDPLLKRKRRKTLERQEGLSAYAQQRNPVENPVENVEYYSYTPILPFSYVKLEKTGIV